jgi:long-chain acyl-CoA synthetase
MNNVFMVRKSWKSNFFYVHCQTMPLKTECELPAHIRGNEHFPSDYYSRLEHGTKEDRNAVINEIIETFPAKNIGEFFSLIADAFDDRVALREYEYIKDGGSIERTMTYRELQQGVDIYAIELMRLGVGHGDRVGMVARNSIDSFLFKYGCESIGGIIVPFTENIADAGMTLAQAMERAKVSRIGLQGERSLKHLIESSHVDFPHVSSLIEHRHIIGIGDQDERRIANLVGVPDVLTTESSLDERKTAVNSHDTAIAMFSPGSGGLYSKMIEVSHANLLYQYFVLPGVIKQPVGSRYLHMLPQHHIFGETVGGIALSMGADMTLTDLRNAKKSLNEQPAYHFLTNVPEGWNIMREQIEKKIPEFITRTIKEDRVVIAQRDIERVRKTDNEELLKETMEYWRSICLPEVNVHQKSLIDIIKWVRAKIARLAFPSIVRKSRLNELRYSMSGGALLTAGDRSFFEALGRADHPLPMRSGYGLTETTSIVSAPDADEEDFAVTVGDVVPGTAVWTRTHPEDGGEELCVAGPGIARYRDPALQKEHIPDGVLHTGDIGTVYHIASESNKKIRHLVQHKRQLKRMIKWKGASILPIPIELLLKKSLVISETLIVGNGQKHLGVLIFPDLQGVQMHCYRSPIEGFDPYNPDWSHPGIREEFAKEIRSLSRRKEIMQSVIIDSFMILPRVSDDLRMASGILHPYKIQEHFKEDIEKMWENNS